MHNKYEYKPKLQQPFLYFAAVNNACCSSLARIIHVNNSLAQWEKKNYPAILQGSKSLKVPPSPQSRRLQQSFE
jgi:hypothetical protein